VYTLLGLLATVCFQSWSNVLSAAEKIAAGLVLVKHAGVAVQNVPVAGLGLAGTQRPRIHVGALAGEILGLISGEHTRDRLAGVAVTGALGLR
jgi:hypothetical protein